jgi:putative DNA primase/helicase
LSAEHPKPGEREPYSPTDLGNARRLVDREGADLRFVGAWGWVAWDGKRWRRDDTGEAERRAKATVRGILIDAGKERDDARARSLAQHGLASQRAGAITAMLQLASTESEIAARPVDFDREPFLLNVVNGTVDLRTGELRPHRREDLITRLAPVIYDPAATCPRWLTHLEFVMQGRRELIEFLARAVGYSLTGDTREQCLFFLHGTGANGKGTTVRTLEALLGDYFRQADFSSFLERRLDGVREDLADLAGARLVAASESGDGRRMAEGLVKTLTGQDTLSVRFLHRDRFTFRPTFKLFLAANEKPAIRGTDEGIWRRIQMIPFDVTIPHQQWDQTLEPELQSRELPGILAWAVRGCRDWLREGLQVPAPVRAATIEYRSEMDVIARFLDEQCILDPNASEGASALYARFQATVGQADRCNPTRFGKELKRREFGKIRDSRGAIRWTGLRLILSEQSEWSERSEPDFGKSALRRAREKIRKSRSDHSDYSENGVGGDTGDPEVATRTALREGA